MYGVCGGGSGGGSGGDVGGVNGAPWWWWWGRVVGRGSIGIDNSCEMDNGNYNDSVIDLNIVTYIIRYITQHCRIMAAEGETNNIYK